MGSEKRINRKLRQEVKALPCTACGRKAPYTVVDPAHIRTFKVSQCDEWWNMMPLCRSHHDFQHRHGWKKLCDNSWKVAEALQERSWEFTEVNGEWKMSNEREIAWRAARANPFGVSEGSSDDGDGRSNDGVRDFDGPNSDPGLLPGEGNE